jgi:dipeptidyl aminopeptidase/acylaminoacyl peptidase
VDRRELDARTKQLEHVTDEQKVLELARKISPITHVSPDDPPTLIIHGDADNLVPIAQAQAIIAKLKEAGVPAELIVKRGAGHGWPGIEKDVSSLADWFDRYLGRHE